MNNVNVPSQPAVSKPPARVDPVLPKFELNSEDQLAMTGMSDIQKKMYILRRRVKVYKEGAKFNRRALKSPNSEREYVWVNSKDERRIFFEGMGWQVCNTSAVGSNYWKEDEQLHRCADLILYEMPKELYQMIEADSVIEGLDRTDPKAAASAFQLAMRNQGISGVPVYEPKVA